MASPAGPETGHERRWALLALTSVGAFMTPLDGSIVAVALPKMGPLLHLSFAASLWVQAAYLLSIAILLIPLGRLADQHGRVRFYLGGIVLFTVASLGAALSRNGTALILSRILQGTGGALLSSTSAAIVTSVFPARERGRALGINVMAVYLGLSVGPPLGGFLVDHAGWPWIFLVNLPIGLLVFLRGWWLLPRVQPPPHPASAGRKQGLDLPGAILLACLLLGLLVPLTFASEWGWRSLRVSGCLGLAALAFVAFLTRESRAPMPLVDLDLLRRNRLFAAANLAALLNYMALYAIAILTAAYLQLVLGLPAKVTGWIMLGQPLTQACLSPLAGRLSDRLGSRLLSTTGMGLVALGMALLGAASGSASLVLVVTALAIVGVGMAAFSAPNTSAILGSVDRTQLSVASAFQGTMRVTGQALSVAVLGGIAASHLGPGGWRLLLRAGGSPQAAEAFVRGYRAAMLTGAALALLGLWASSARGAHGPRAES
ncbi:MFS transporter [Geothrix limicola]|uniref:MFS transporter n=1 Tax=Geothrix limicola TaxID=2927978 RepID=A0ABQ5QGC3_9BACT|nr:MFS transporter [Geothrix limicola]GLH73623.1 MFS transporter [Geothrix limicola]